MSHPAPGEAGQAAALRRPRTRPLHGADVCPLQRADELWILRGGRSGHRVCVGRVLGAVEGGRHQRVGGEQRPQIYKHHPRAGLGDQEAAGPRGRGAEHPPLPWPGRA